jgi:DNA-directed RNA polymerase specialized sigma subunit
MLSQKKELQKMKLSSQELKRALDPMQSFHLQLSEEIESYERLLRREFAVLRNLHGLGRQLVGCRIASGLTQRELAKRLKVNESQVSRDERNEYHGISVERASEILDAIGVDFKSHCDSVPMVQAKLG